MSSNGMLCHCRNVLGRRAVAVLVAAIHMAAGSRANATSIVSPPALEANPHRVQAAYLYNFGKFIQWPQSAPANKSGTFTICTFEEDSVAEALESTLPHTAERGKPITIRRVSHARNADACHILFIGAAHSAELSAILACLDGSAVLTVSDIPDFSKRGGMIQFLLEDGRVRFEINLDRAEKSHLLLPSELLKVAAAVRKTARSGE